MNELLDDDLLTLLLEDVAGDMQANSHRLDRAPLSFAQQRLWLEHQRDPARSAYNLPRALRLSGELDADALEQALNRVIDRHDILRTAFNDIDGAPVQVVERDACLVLHREDLGDLAPQARATALSQRIELHAGQPFDLSRAPLMRATLLRLDSDEHVLLLNMHHIVSDAWSNTILMQDMTQAYAQAVLGDPTPLPQLPMQYADYATHQRGEYLQSSACQRSGEYWSRYLGQDLPTLELPQDFPRATGQQHMAGRVHLSLAPAMARALDTFCQRQGLTPFVVALGAWQMLLVRYSNQDDFTVGVPNANRNSHESQDLVGFFVSSQVYRTRIDSSRSGLDFLRDLRAQALAALEHADYPLELILDQLQRPGAQGLFQVLFNWRTGSPALPISPKGELALEFLDTGDSQAKFDLSLDVDYSQQQIVATFEYSRDLYRTDTIERMAEHWQNLLRGLIETPERALGELQLLSADERQQTLHDWNRQPTQLPRERCLHQVIESHAATTGDAMALTFEGLHMSYVELNRRANQLAHRLIEQGVGPDVLVGIAVERTPQMIIGLLAILKAGGAYVPLDPAYPADRLAYMIEDSGVTQILTQAHLRESLALPAGIGCLLLDSVDADSTYPEHNPDVPMHPDNLAYVIYTSGSTGKPKGALLAHHNVSRLFQATEHWFSFDHRDVWCLFHSYAFDFSVWEIFGALLHGGRLVIVPHAVSRSPQEFYALLCQENVTVLNQTPSAFKSLLQVACEPRQPLAHRLRQVIFGGEAIDVQSLRPWFERFGDQSPQLINMYGITETTVHVTWRPLSIEDLHSETASPIGQPIVDLSWYLLDAHLNPVPKGCIGELYVGRAGLARGYHQRADLTASRFIPDPFDPLPGGRLYRTGDLARYRTDGSIEYIGRLDHQVKIRGFRIELGEIQARLQTLPAVQDCVVLTHDGPTGLQLVAYVIATQPPSAELREGLLSALKAQLPDYMVPSHLLFIDRFPLNANGKLDRKALPEPDASLRHSNYVAPRTQLEEALAQLWQQSLKVERVGVNDSFFELGGHSILAIELIANLKARLNITVRLQELLAHPSIVELALFISQKHREQTPCLVELNNAPASAPQLFCLHPSGGIVFCYQPLARKLQHRARTVGVMHRGFSEPHASPEAWREMIADYSREIVNAQPQGPYYLMGWSLGGTIALDIAATLESQGHKVNFLGLVDSTIPEHLYPATLSRHRHLPGDEQADPASQDLLGAIEYFDLLFPTLTERTATYRQQNPDSTVQAFHEWAASQIEPGRGDLLSIVQSVKDEVMNAQAFSVHDRLLEAFDRFTFKPVRVRPSCWWTQAEKTPEELAFCENLIKGYSLTGELQCSVHSPLRHRSMIFDEGLLDSLIEVFLGSTTHDK
ncbi:amino acid adenylation domain-containing protein [Pseudomonas sp. NFACC23-1]|uniref:non-ribosomal peptide synthetase n=1 Tax=unclassified Pseudomonas TaxID=196821 RepID=UPI0008807E76|nr:MULTISPECIES: non-ribosomal peptide synthetase [unclassified Pseudomonas]SDB42584.1 amino acid adenylation domain-containing protein [Pseudomonas sp. NFACC17-2]SEJ60488.1 amino acid adenylation domain-containing protein [Pseudomonas sp. NFACC23-1]SFW77569.1 amino acid adenylation domain-containing protein [Pseudomonas sp. NFACC16-2]